AVSQYIHPPPKKPRPESLFGVMALFGVGGLVAVYVAIGLRGLRYLVFPGHLVAVQGSKRTVLRWDQIREVYQFVHPAWKKYNVVTRIGKTLTITGDTRGHTRLGDHIAERVAEILLPGALKRLEDGQTLSFGPLSISRAGIECNGELVPWHHIGTLTFGLDMK